MFSHNPILNDFVCSIPVCQPEADLGTILNIFQQTNCDLLAVPGKNHTWGTISSQNLLSLLAQVWQHQATTTVGYPKKITSHRHNLHLKVEDLAKLAEPADLLPDKLKLSDFVTYLQNASLLNSKKEYLLVNEIGELQGRLDYEKLLKYLATRLPQTQTNVAKLPALSVALLNLIDSIALPLKIETAEGDNFYINQCWQESIATTQAKNPQQEQNADISIATWWLKQQLTAQENDNLANLSIATGYCSKSGYQIKSSSNLGVNGTSLNLVPEELSCFHEYAIAHLAENSYFNLASAANSPLSIQIEQVEDWHHIKIPLTLTTQKLSHTNKSIYWLILATKISTKESEAKHQPNAASANVKSIVDQLLATVSHELKSPLTGMIGLSSLLKIEKLGELNQRQTRYVDLIHDSGQKMMSIVNDLLKFTSLTTEKLELKTEIIELEPLFRQLYRQVLKQLKSLDLLSSDPVIQATTLQLDLEPASQIAIADKARLSRIISYLLLETIKCAQSFTTLTIQIKVKAWKEWTAITIGSQPIDNPIFLSNAQDLEQLKPSLGLNLLMAKYIAEILQGQIKTVYLADSCQFVLLLPRVSSSLDQLPLSTPGTAKNDLTKNLTILCLYPEPEVINPVTGQNSDLDFELKNWAEQDLLLNDGEQQSNYRHRIIEADGLEQAHMLARIWQLDAIVLDGYQIVEPTKYLRSLQKSEYLSNLPLITLDTKTTEAANQIDGLNVYPCLLPAECRSIKDLMQVIQIATNV